MFIMIIFLCKHCTPSYVHSCVKQRKYTFNKACLFGPGSKYWKNLSFRSKYKKVKDWRGMVKGPWIHQNIIETVNNIKSNNLRDYCSR